MAQIQLPSGDALKEERRENKIQEKQEPKEEKKTKKKTNKGKRPSAKSLIRNPRWKTTTKFLNSNTE